MRWINMFFAILLAIITITMSYPRPEIQHLVPQIDNSSIVGSDIPKLPSTLLDNRDNNSALIDSDKDMFNDLQAVLLDEPVKFTKVKYSDGTEERLEATEAPLDDDTKLMWKTYNEALRKIYGDLENDEDKNILMTNDAAANRSMDYSNKIYEKLQSQHEKSKNDMEDSQWRQKQVSDMSHFLKLTIGNKTLDEMKKAAITLNVEQLALNYYDIKNIITNNTVDSTQNLTFTDKVEDLKVVNKHKKTKKTTGNLRKQNKAAAREEASSTIKTNQELQMNDNGALSRETLKKYEYDTFDPTLVVVDVNKDSEIAPGENDAKQNTNENKKPKFVYKKGNVPPFNPSIWTQMDVESAKKHVSK